MRCDVARVTRGDTGRRQRAGGKTGLNGGINAEGRGRGGARRALRQRRARQLSPPPASCLPLCLLARAFVTHRRASRQPLLHLLNASLSLYGGREALCAFSPPDRLASSLFPPEHSHPYVFCLHSPTTPSLWFDLPTRAGCTFSSTSYDCHLFLNLHSSTTMLWLHTLPTALCNPTILYRLFSGLYPPLLLKKEEQHVPVLKALCFSPTKASVRLGDWNGLRTACHL